MYYGIRFILIFTILSALVGIGSFLGATPSSWTVAILIVASLVMAYMTKQEEL